MDTDRGLTRNEATRVLTICCELVALGVPVKAVEPIIVWAVDRLIETAQGLGED